MYVSVLQKKLLKQNKENELSTYQYFCLLSSKSFGIFQRPEDIAVECQLLICRQNGLQSEHILIRHTDTTENITFQQHRWRRVINNSIISFLAPTKWFN